MRLRLPKDTLRPCRLRSHARGEPTTPFFCPRCQRTVCSWCRGPREGSGGVCRRCRQGLPPLLRLARGATRAARTAVTKASKLAIRTEVLARLDAAVADLGRALQQLVEAGALDVEGRRKYKSH